MLLVHPPVVKPCEPPAGIASLSTILNHYGVRCSVLDSNLEGLLYLLRSPQASSDTWTNRASRNLSRHLTLLRSWTGYHRFDRYGRAVMDLNRLLQMSTFSKGARLGLGNYEDKELLPLKSRDLIRAGENPEENPFYPYFRERLLECLEQEQPSIVGLSLNYLSQALCTFAMIGFLRRECPGLTLVLGGGLITSWMKRPHWQNPFKGLVDRLVAGPGEVPLLSMAGAKRFAEDHCTPNYNPFPLKEYLAPGPIFPYSASRGCYWNRCSFCPERIEKNPYLPVPVDRVVSDLTTLVKEENPLLIHLVDNAVSPAVMKAISEHPPGVPWYGFARITHHLTDLDFCMALRRSGCVMVKLGLESGDQGVLDHMEKGIDLEEACQALKALRKAGIAAYVYLLFGTPWETLAEARRTLEFTVKHCDEISFLNLALFNQPVSWPESKEIETKHFYEGDLSLYTDFVHPKGWDRKLVRQFLDKEFKRHPAIASILRRDPPVFTSNHAPIFVMKPSRG